MVIKPNFESLCGEFELSNQLKDFTNLAKKARENYIIEVFCKKNTNLPFRCIPITQQEAIAQENESKMTNAELAQKIEILLEQMNDNIRPKYRGLGSKKKSDLLLILNEIRNLYSQSIIINEEEVEQ